MVGDGQPTPMRTTGRLLAALLAVSLLVPTAAGAPLAAQQSVDADVVVMTATVEPDGDAQWSIDYRVRLDSENDSQAFEELRADIEANPENYTSQFGSRMQRTANTAANATGRSMAIENVTVSTRVENVGDRFGVVTYRFRWTNFAAVSGDRLVVGDAVAGLFLDGGTSLKLAWSDDYRAESVSPSADERSETGVTWRGQEEFASDEPSVILAPAAGGGDDGGGGDSGGFPMAGFALLGLAALAVGVFAFRQFGLGGGLAGGTDDSGDAGGTDGGAGGDGASAAPTEPPAELLSNEEQVLKLLEEHGGRIKQQRVAGELDWTDAKTSQVIGGLREESEVETFRIGRENVVTLPDTEVTGSDLTEETDE